MAQKIKVQDGNVVYSTNDPSNTDLNFSVEGSVNVTKEVSVGDDPLANGTISTPSNSGVDLIVSTNTDGSTNGNIRFEPITGGNILLNNVAWPDGSVSPDAGMFVGTASLNNLQFYSFICGIAPDDDQTKTDLNTLFPAAVTGQISLGPNVMYYCTGLGNWRKIPATPVIDAPMAPYYNLQILEVTGPSIFPSGSELENRWTNIVADGPLVSSTWACIILEIGNSTGSTLSFNASQIHYGEFADNIVQPYGPLYSDSTQVNSVSSAYIVDWSYSVDLVAANVYPDTGGEGAYLPQLFGRDTYLPAGTNLSILPGGSLKAVFYYQDVDNSYPRAGYANFADWINQFTNTVTLT